MDSGRRDSRGRPVKVSDGLGEARADAPAPVGDAASALGGLAELAGSNVRPDDSPIDVGVRVSMVSSHAWTDRNGVQLTHRIVQAGRVTEMGDSGFTVEFDEVLDESGVPTTFEPFHPASTDLAWFAVEERMRVGELVVLRDPVTADEIGPDWLRAQVADGVSIAADEWERAKESGRPEMAAKMAEFANCYNDAEFVELVSAAVYESALCSRFKGNWEHVHAVCTFAWEEAQRRPKAKCSRHSLYARGHRKSMMSAGHDPGPAPDCTCEGDG